MMLFKKNPDLSRGEALAARPVRADASVCRDEAGGAKVKVELKGPRWGGWLFKMSAGATKTYELDELGLFVWDACDGKTSVQQLIRKLAKQYSLNLREAEVATVKFLQMLMTRGLIGMTLKEKQKE